jgi:hypothetical protein
MPPAPRTQGATEGDATTMAGCFVTSTDTATPLLARPLCTAVGLSSADAMFAALAALEALVVTVTCAVTEGVEAATPEAPTARATDAGRLVRAATSDDAAAVLAPLPETVTGTEASSRRRRPLAVTAPRAMLAAAAPVALARPLMSAEEADALSVVMPPSVKRKTQNSRAAGRASVGRSQSRRRDDIRQWGREG